jgi:hypothetical protein
VLSLHCLCPTRPAAGSPSLLPVLVSYLSTYCTPMLSAWHLEVPWESLWGGSQTDFPKLHKSSGGRVS